MFELLLLIIVANATPVLLGTFLGTRWAWPVDGGRQLRDGRPVFGSSKTWRGLIAGVLATTAVAALLGRPALLGCAAGALALSGDLCASFAKRRLGYATSDFAPLLDTLPESLLPAVLLQRAFGLGWLEVTLLVVVFHVAVRLGSPLLYRLRIRPHPW